MSAHSESFHEEHPRNDNESEPHILDIREARHIEAPHIARRSLLTPEAIAAKEGIEVGELEKYIQGQVGEWAHWMEEKYFTPANEKYAALVEEIYALFRYTKDNKEVPQELEWTRALLDPETFCARFCPTASKNARGGMFAGNVRTFTERIVHPQRVIEIFPSEVLWGGEHRQAEGYRKEIHEANGNWVLLPDVSNYAASEEFAFAEESVIREIIALLESGYREPDYSHASGSAAFPAIGRHGAILSAEEAVKRGEIPKTGEFSHYMDYNGEGLNSVYADRGGPRYGYHVINWFDEYFVTFGINKERQEVFMESTDVRYGYGDEPKTMNRDLGSEGMLIGHAVPLSAVDIVYCWKKYESQTTDWVKEFCPHARVVSLEAAETLRGYDSVMNVAALQEGVSPSEAWGKLLK
ncbi:MAG: hypothetical protein HYY92_01220 [Parcubacteria group bacterium]|nr:hypothetical protein [Parcubacteria group bacterium]